MKTRGWGFTYTKYGNVLGEEIRVMPAPRKLGRRDLLRNTAIGCSTVVIDREFMGEMRFPAAPAEDLAFWSVLLGEARMAHLASDELFVLRQLGGRSANKFNAAGRYWRTLRDTLGIPRHEAVTHLVPYAVRAARKHWILPEILRQSPQAVGWTP
jgi:teichuronic acid biosynthesis glycosyltransferase TuaG